MLAELQSCELRLPICRVFASDQSMMTSAVPQFRCSVLLPFLDSRDLQASSKSVILKKKKIWGLFRIWTLCKGTGCPSLATPLTTHSATAIYKLFSKKIYLLATITAFSASARLLFLFEVSFFQFGEKKAGASTRFFIQAPMRLRGQDQFRVAVNLKPPVDIVVRIPAIHCV
ncbi:hypothetical protein LXL04_033635 [Taraxacum kok-saghyz]